MIGQIERFLTFGGLTSVTIGALFGLISIFKGKEARQLQSITYVENLAELKQFLGLIPIIVAVTGKVFCPKPLQCDLSEQEGAIIELTEDKKSETKTSSNVWILENDRLREVVRETDWALTPTSSAEATTIHLPVLGGRKASGEYLQISADIFTQANDGALEQVLRHLAGRKNIGIRQRERYLPQGSVITAVGELTTSYAKPDGEFKHSIKPAPGSGMMYVLRAPRKGPFILSNQRLPELISSAQLAAAVCADIAGWCTAIGVSMLFVVGSRKAFVKYRERMMRLRIEEARKRRESLRGGTSGTKEEDSTSALRHSGKERPAAVGADEHDAERVRGTCVVCLDRASDYVFPCGHLCVCEGCLRSSGSMRGCPVCRSKGNPIRVYIT